ncbi:calcium-translocating P-type ATPase [Choiromyces venosus 120613-1]|uniref:Calcium-transporting ATPase n=1 Tax=Choiromyces venosus 120613-1 TaxID=1336337 RepID=A0A3N4JFC5_9PEZI|nr:calcium-translocating P-type ATPase [Choiromyces venosus 120613-1]
MQQSDDKFLAVPGARSRGNSIETPSSEGDVTLVPGKPVVSNTTTADKSLHEDEDPLRPYTPDDPEFIVDNNTFAFTPGQLGRLYMPKSHAAFKALGGLRGLEIGLRTDRKTGLSLDETSLDGRVTFEQAVNHQTRDGGEHNSKEAPFAPATTNGTTPVADLKSDSHKERKRVFKDNRLPVKKTKNIFQLMWIAFMDKVLLLLSGAAVISLALGLYQTFGGQHKKGEGARVDWVEGVAIMVAIVIVVVVGAGNDYQKERQFVKLNKKKEDRLVKVIRSGKSLQISVYDLLVGDVCHMEPGDLIPADGIFISGHNVKADESSATGESDQMKKTAADEVMAKIEANDPGVHKLDCFIISGSKILEGIGTFMVTNAGVHSSFGKTMMALREETEATPLQMKLNNLAEAIAKLGGASALLLFIVLLIKFLVQLRDSHDTPSEKGQSFMRILITAVTVVVVAVPEGLPLAVTLALAFATTRMLKDHNLVRVLRACETMGNATTICSDKTGTLTQNKMTVVAGTLGTVARFGAKSPTTSITGDPKDQLTAADTREDVSVAEFVSMLSPQVKELLRQSIVINSTAFEGEENGEVTFIGSKTETSLLGFARGCLGMGPVSEERANCDIVQLIPFDSARKCMGSVIKLPNGKYRMFVKGASEILLAKCTRIVNDISASEVLESQLTEENVRALHQIISNYANRSLRTIDLIYRDFASWPPEKAQTLADDPSQVDFDDVFRDMVFLSVVGIQDPLRDGVSEAVSECQKAGVFVRMVTGDNLITAKAIATECGIYTSGGIVMEGPKFRQLSTAQMDQIIPRLQVLARSSPEDKRILVRRLKELGETVAVTGDGTNDGPALKMADVGFSMGIAGTEVAKEASSIILMDDNFASIVKAIMWGRAVNDAVKKFLQFQLTVNITAVLLTFVSAVASGDESSVLSAVQLLWVNLIMDTFAALALATDPPTRVILDRRPDPKSAPLITITMWKMILGQAVYQLVVAFVLNFAGKSILGYTTKDQAGQLKTLVFNTFVWMQIFNQYNNRRLDNKFNIFEGVQNNWFFIGINFVMVGGQIMIIFVGGKAFGVTKLNGVQWAISIILGAISIPVAVIIRLIPDLVFAKILPNWMSKKESTNIYVGNQDRFQWNEGIEAVREELAFLKMVRGGRLNQLKFSRQNVKQSFSHIFRYGGSKNEIHTAEDGTLPPPSPSSQRRRRSRSNSAFAAAAMVPSIVAGSIGGWSPIEKPADEPASRLPSRGESQDGTLAPPSLNPNDNIREVSPSSSNERTLTPPKF